MYKLLLCWRYLRTRYIALVSIISVTLGVATMIVVNSVMEGFTSEMQNRIHGIISDVVFEVRSSDGAPDSAWHMEEIRKVAGDDIEAMAPVVRTMGVVSIPCDGEWITHPVMVVGIDEKLQGSVGDFSRYLQHPANRKQMSFELREGGYDVRDHQAGPDAPERPRMGGAGWGHRRKAARRNGFQREYLKPENPDAQPAPLPSDDPFAPYQTKENLFDPEKDQHTGVVLGFAMATYPQDGENKFLALPGDDVRLTFPTVGQPPKGTSDNFTVVDLYESKMSEYDSQFVFVPIRDLQRLRGMIDPSTQIGNFNLIQIKLKPGVDGNQVRDKLRAAFRPTMYTTYTWRDNQGPLLQAVEMETAILNILLFLIIAVAGFGILAIFYMIVVEKTRDIGILKSLGAPGRGIMGIFLAYGLLLGLVGSGVGMGLGLLFVYYINEIAKGLGWLTGRPVFDPSIYYFYKIPAIVVPQTLTWIVFGALGIAVAASILPARRAARLHPVEALRNE